MINLSSKCLFYRRVDVPLTTKNTYLRNSTARSFCLTICLNQWLFLKRCSLLILCANPFQLRWQKREFMGWESWSTWNGNFWVRMTQTRRLGRMLRSCWPGRTWRWLRITMRPSSSLKLHWLITQTMSFSWRQATFWMAARYRRCSLAQCPQFRFCPKSWKSRLRRPSTSTRLILSWGVSSTGTVHSR